LQRCHSDVAAKRLQGSLFGGGNPHYDIPELLAMRKLGDLNLDADR